MLSHRPAPPAPFDVAGLGMRYALGRLSAMPPMPEGVLSHLIRLLWLVLMAAGVVIAVLFLASLPLILTVSDTGLVLNVESFPRTAASYAAGLWSGESFIYQRGGGAVNFLRVASSTFPTSLLYAGSACIIAVLVGTLLGTYIGASKRQPVQDLLSALGAVPDFILVLLLQITVVGIYHATGARVARVASIARDEPALLLPLIVLAIIPTAYLLAGVSATVREVATQDFVTAAKARGLGRGLLLRRHALPHAVLHGRAHAGKMAALVIGNLFIVEYLFNIPGVTGVLFDYAWKGLYRWYQPQLVINSLFAIIALYGVLLFLIRALNAALMRISGRG